MKKICSLFIGALLCAKGFSQNMGLKETISYINQRLMENPRQLRGLLHFQISVSNGILSVTETDDFGEAGKIINQRSILINDIMSCDKKDYPFDGYGNINIYCDTNLNGYCIHNKFFTAGSNFDEDDTSIAFYKKHGIFQRGLKSIGGDINWWDNVNLTHIIIRLGNSNIVPVTTSILNAFQHLIFLLKNEPEKISSGLNDPFAKPVNHDSPQTDASNKSTINTNSTATITTNNSNVIPMIKKGSIYEIPVVINGSLKLNFIFDSGASDVSISPDVALTLIRTGTISESDFIGTNTYTFADGTSAKSTTFNIKKINIGNRTIYNVKASISNSIDAPLLLGQSLLNRLGRVTIDYTNNTIVIQNKL